MSSIWDSRSRISTIRRIGIMLFLTAGPVPTLAVVQVSPHSAGIRRIRRSAGLRLTALDLSSLWPFHMPRISCWRQGWLWLFPCFYGCANVHTQRTQVFFVAALFATQLLLVSTLDGGLTGWLRERLFMCCFPISGHARGTSVGIYVDVRQWFVFAGVPIAIAGVLLLYPFQAPIPLETPWAFALGAGVSKLRLAVLSVAGIVVFSFFLFRFRRVASVILAAGILVFHAATLFLATRNMEASVAPAMAVLQPVKEWLAKEGVVRGSRLLVAGRHNYFEPQHTECRIDGKLLDWTWRLGLPESTVWAIETLGRYDVRMIPSVPEFAAVSKPGDSSLTIAQPLGLDFVSRHPPYSLYRVPSGVQWDRVTFSYGR